ncbi:MAG: alpha/beta hydrolase [Clostridia bacterium]|nr:alpha/beta hydrolase [Clostridia bacterium]
MLRNAKNGSVRIGDSCMTYVSFGRGRRSLVVLPGLSDGLATVRGKALLLAGPYRRFLDRYTVYMFSRRDDLPDGFTIRDMAADQAEAMRCLGLERASVLGVSEGGMIAQYLAADAPRLLDRLVLAVTAPRLNGTTEERLRKWIALAEAGDHKALMIDTAENSYSPAYLKRYRRLYPVLGAVGRPKSYRRFLVNARAILAFDASPELERILRPTLILGGREDRIVGAEASLELQKGIRGSELYVYPGLGHAAYEEAKDFYARVFAFLDRP